MVMRSAGALLFAMFAAGAGWAAPFTVRDSIEMTVLSDPDVLWTDLRAAEVKRSPDGRLFFIVTRKGDLQSGTNEYSLLLFSVDDVRKRLLMRQLPGTATAQLPVGTLAARFRSSSNRPGIARAQWLADSKSIAFIGENPGATPQVFTLNTETQDLRKLTCHNTPVLDFSLGDDGETLIYLAASPPDWSHRLTHGFVVTNESLMEVVGQGRYELFPRASYYISHGCGKPPTPVAIDAQRLVGDPYGMWLSPGGRWAAVVEHVPAPPASWWREYRPLSSAAEGYFKGAEAKDLRTFTADNPAYFLRFSLVDMMSGNARPILDAPTGYAFSGLSLNAHWLSDTALILANTFLPLDVSVDPAELSRRRRSPAIAEVDLESGGISRITDLNMHARDGQEIENIYFGSRMDGKDTLIVSWNPTIGMAAEETAFRKRGGKWERVTTHSVWRKEAIHIRIAQDLNSPPELMAQSGRRRALITNLNPHFRDLALGHAEVYSWRDTSGRVWSGGLLRPPQMIAGKRYPLVIQAGSFRPGAFWVDGAPGVSSGFAARALANRGMVVLQVPRTVAPGFRDELTNVTRGYEAAIRDLSDKGLIDPEHVGIHGFSRTGFYVQHALVFSSIKFAAASVSDPSALGFFTYVSFFGLGYPGMLEQERMIGEPPWGDETARLWAERDPTLHLDRVRTPLRIEEYGAEGFWWDTFSILRRHQRPVEYVSIPEGAHGLLKPWERLTSQEGVVDWFDFWLNNHEDPNIAKKEQYRRWHELRTERDELLRVSADRHNTR